MIHPWRLFRQPTTGPHLNPITLYLYALVTARSLSPWPGAPVAGAELAVAAGEHGLRLGLRRAERCSQTSRPWSSPCVALWVIRRGGQIWSYGRRRATIWAT
jgi:hypothetical protein